VLVDSGQSCGLSGNPGAGLRGPSLLQKLGKRSSNFALQPLVGSPFGMICFGVFKTYLRVSSTKQQVWGSKWKGEVKFQ
jgi:hypothetical protein